MANLTMVDLMASLDTKPLNLYRGQKAQGTVVLVTDSEIVVDLGSKSEGILEKVEMPQAKVGDMVNAFVISSKGESGQIKLSLHQNLATSAKGSFKKWNRFISALNNKSNLNVYVVEQNKGGLLVEAERVRGFLPLTQINYLKNPNLEKLAGQILSVKVLEVDPSSNRLIFSQRGEAALALKQKAADFKAGDKVKGKIVAVLPFGLVMDLGGIEGIVHIFDVAWEKVEDLNASFKVGDEVETQISGLDTEFGRLNLSLKALGDDPFKKFSQDHQVDDVVTGSVVKLSENGVIFNLTEGIEGLLHISKIEPGQRYEVGQKVQLLIDSIDPQRRRVSLAPLLTSTAGLIYK